MHHGIKVPVETMWICILKLISYNDYDTCRTTFKKQLLPRFCNPGTTHDFSGEDSLSDDDDHDKNKLLKPLLPLSSLKARIKPATLSMLLAIEIWNPDEVTQWAL